MELMHGYFDSKELDKVEQNIYSVQATPQCVKLKGTWCPVCSMEISKKYLVHTKDTIENMQQIAISRKGKCLSKRYIYSNVKLKWECEFGHTWSATPSGVKSGNWCPTCGKEKSKAQLVNWRRLKRQVTETSIANIIFETSIQNVNFIVLLKFLHTIF